MIVKVDNNDSIGAVKKVRIETANFTIRINVCNITGNLIINKTEGVEDGKMFVFPRASNEIEVK